MKRGELVLDFTSLLDVILILLFIVTSGIGQSSQAASDRAEQSAAQAQARAEALEGERGRLSQELDELREKYDRLLEDYDYLKITSRYDAGDTSVYRQAIGRVTQAVLDCRGAGSGSTAQAEFRLYVAAAGGDGRAVFSGQRSVVHDFALSPAQRAERSAQQANELAKLLADTLRDDDAPVIWFTIQYNYEDENFTYSDLEIIRKAINIFEAAFDKPCYYSVLKRQTELIIS